MLYRLFYVEVIVGVNKYQHKASDDGDKVQVLQIDNTQVRKQQIARIEKIKKERDSDAAAAALADLSEAAKNPAPGKNLLDLSIKAARLRCTVGEISSALESVYGRHQPTIRIVSGAYKTEYG